jgi:hypothetical protein
MSGLAKRAPGLTASDGKHAGTWKSSVFFLGRFCRKLRQTMSYWEMAKRGLTRKLGKGGLGKEQANKLLIIQEAIVSVI